MQLKWVAYRVATGFLIAGLFSTGPARGDVGESRRLFRTGKYVECLDQCTKAIEGNDWAESWWVLKLRAEMEMGRYADALNTYQTALSQQPASIRVRLLGYDVLRMNNRAADAAAIPQAIAQLVANDPAQYDNGADRTALGQAMLIGGVDARQVLERLWDPARKAFPDAPEPLVASGELALKKNDFALAAESFQTAIKFSPDDPDLYLGLAIAYDNDTQRSSAALKKAIELNPRHIGSLLFEAANAINQEAFEPARELLKQVLDINPHEFHAWAYRAALAHLSGDFAGEKQARIEALAVWPTNPEVDHLIGEKISQKYRFAEGQGYQRQSLIFDPAFQPAKIQLCQDLLRLGQEDEGWRLADEAFAADPYNVLAFNLTTLRDNLAKFAVSQDQHFLIRMDHREQQIYGSRVQDLLSRARVKLSAKYGVELPDKTIVEIFPQLKDFAIRTFGLPGGAGYLGVCFGRVITANSPASRPGHPANWEAVLWHEFCHVVTLSKTHSKMPRWLSEGISVYEERQENPAWGQTMTPQYREMILAHGETPVSQLSGAFLKATEPIQIQFAYYESSMVVRFVIERFGFSSLQQVLTDLSNDVPINDALSRHTEPIDKLDDDFSKWLNDGANQLAPKVNWDRPPMPLDAGSEALAPWVKDHPTSFYGLLALGQSLVAEGKWDDAKASLKAAAVLYPTYAELGGPYMLLAAADRGLGDTQAERAMLEKHASLNADAVEVRLRLLKILADQKDFNAMRNVAEQIVAVNPLIAAPHRYLADAAEALGDRSTAITAERVLLMMNPPDLADRHYRLAKLLTETGRLPEARKEVVCSLEEAPRFRDAYRLLLAIADKMPATHSIVAPPDSARGADK